MSNEMDKSPEEMREEIKEMLDGLDSKQLYQLFLDMREIAEQKDDEDYAGVVEFANEALEIVTNCHLRNMVEKMNADFGIEGDKFRDFLVSGKMEGYSCEGCEYADEYCSQNIQALIAGYENNDEVRAVFGL